MTNATSQTYAFFAIWPLIFGLLLYDPPIHKRKIKSWYGIRINIMLVDNMKEGFVKIYSLVFQ